MATSKSKSKVKSAVVVKSAAPVVKAGYKHGIVLARVTNPTSPTFYPANVYRGAELYWKDPTRKSADQRQIEIDTAAARALLYKRS